jgi:hypothetical protein
MIIILEVTKYRRPTGTPWTISTQSISWLTEHNLITIIRLNNNNIKNELVTEVENDIKTKHGELLNKENLSL